ncbi:C39 family peptidase [Actinomadura sp. B10D3]|uniref:C39 family peptidase n=1 Tax=Actinomadura sp. B10D3 TaxID=3153557 RepID=UPI00325F8861
MPVSRWIIGGVATLAATAAVTTGIVVSTADTRDGGQVGAAGAAQALPTKPAAVPQGMPYEPVPTPRDQPALKKAAFAPSSYTVKITGQYQSKSNWCVPTSSSISLRTLGVKVSQATLAKKMKTSGPGTTAKQALPVLNAYAKPKHLAYRVGDDISSGTKLLNKVKYDVGILHRATILGVWADDLPWNSKQGFPNKTGHAVVVYGYNASKKTITVWDPWKATGGKHTISASKLSSVSQKGAMFVINPTL